MNRATYNLASLALSRSFLSGGHSAAVFRPRLLLTARLFSSAAVPSMSPPSSKWLTPSIAVAGGIVAGAGVATYFEEQVYAKEMPLSPEKMPKEVVLYQYEACPFCNKVKGIHNTVFHCVCVCFLIIWFRVSYSLISFRLEIVYDFSFAYKHDD